MNKGAIVDGIKKAKRLLKKADINYSENTSFPHDYLLPNKLSDEFIRVSQEKEYDTIHKIALSNGDYDILLDDYSFFQFTQDSVGVLRYAFYQSAREIPTYDSFMESIGFSKEDYNQDIEEERPFSNDYEQIISEANLSNSVTPIRYDYNKKQYQRIIHPISHLHIGHDNDVRIPMNIILTPQAFVAFVIRHVYYKHWKLAIVNQEFQKEYLSIKNTCMNIEIEDFDVDEQKDLFLI